MLPFTAAHGGAEASRDPERRWVRGAVLKRTKHYRRLLQPPQHFLLRVCCSPPLRLYQAQRKNSRSKEEDAEINSKWEVPKLRERDADLVALLASRVLVGQDEVDGSKFLVRICAHKKTYARDGGFRGDAGE